MHPGDYDIRCRKCEEKLGKPVAVMPELYGVVPNTHGAVVRKCTGSDCGQLWLGYVQQLPSLGMKIIQKAIDKVL